MELPIPITPSIRQFEVVEELSTSGVAVWLNISNRMRVENVSKLLWLNTSNYT